MINVEAAELSNLPVAIDRVKPAIVAIGTFLKTRRPPAIFRGTGFVITDGLHVITNVQALPEKTDQEKKDIIAVFSGNGNAIDMREATLVILLK